MGTDNTMELDIPIEGMSCASCAGRVERALAALPGVQSVAVNLATESARVRGATLLSWDSARSAVAKECYGVRQQ